MKKIISFVVSTILFSQISSAPIFSMSNEPMPKTFESEYYTKIDPKSQILDVTEKIAKCAEYNKIKHAINVVFNDSDLYLLKGALSLGLDPSILKPMREAVSSILLNYGDGIRSMINSIDFNDKDPYATTLFILAFTKIYNLLCDSNWILNKI